MQGPAAREEAALQRSSAGVTARGSSVKSTEPEPGLIGGHAMVPDGFTFAARPQLVAGASPAVGSCWYWIEGLSDAGFSPRDPRGLPQTRLRNPLLPTTPLILNDLLKDVGGIPAHGNQPGRVGRSAVTVGVGGP
jgi:hypothetical protein